MRARWLGLGALLFACFGADPAPPGPPSSDDGGADTGALPEPGPAASLSFTVADATVVRGADLTLKLTITSSDPTVPLVARVQNTPWVASPGDIAIAGGATAELRVRTTADSPFGDNKVEVFLSRSDGALGSTVAASVFVRGEPGTLDTSFGKDGAVNPLVGTQIAGVFLDDDDTLYVKGHDPTGTLSRRPFVVHYDAGGVRDGKFGEQGVWTVAAAPPDAGPTALVSVSIPIGKDRWAIRRRGAELLVMTSTKRTPLSSNQPIPYDLQRSRITPAGVTLETTLICTPQNSRFDDAPFGLAPVAEGAPAWTWTTQDLGLADTSDLVLIDGCGPAISVANPMEGNKFREMRGVAVADDHFFLLREAHEPSDPVPVHQATLFVVDATNKTSLQRSLNSAHNANAEHAALSRPNADGQVLVSHNALNGALLACLQRISKNAAVEYLPATACNSVGTAFGSIPLFRRDGAVTLLLFGLAPALYDYVGKQLTPLRKTSGGPAIDDLAAIDAVVDVIEDSRGRLIVVSGVHAWQIRRFWL